MKNHSLQSTRQNVWPFFRSFLCLTIGFFVGFASFGAALAQAESDSAIPVVAVHKDTDGVTLTMNPGLMKLQVFSPDVIRVLYSREATAPPSTSLTVIAKPGKVDWKLAETKDDVRLQTSEIEVRVNRASGAVAFFDKQGKSILAELPEGGRRLTPNRIGELDTLKAEQSFVLPADEALYGLGQHQEGVMNYHGSSVRLLQENREVAVPVLVSSRGYGVLWDNAAVTIVNAGAKGAEVIGANQLFSEEGQAGGLSAAYYSGDNFEKLAEKRIDPQIDFDWSEHGPANLPHDHYSVRWTGFLEAAEGGEYTLLATADDGVRVWVDDKPIFDDWTQHAATTLIAKINFEAHRRHKFRMEYFQAGGGAVARLAWRKPAQPGLPLTWSSEAGNSIDYYFLYGPDLDKVIGGYRRLTGAAPLFGKWAWGFWQCRNRYQSQQELTDVVGKYRSMHVPIDGIIQDWQYWNPHPWGSHQFDEKRYPDPSKLMTDLHDAHAHMLISVWPKFDVDSPNAKELRDAGGLYPKVLPYVYPPGNGQWYDSFNATARRIYWQQMSQKLFKFGLDGWWLDASEPELSGRWGEFREFKTAEGPGANVFNAYPLFHTKAVYEGQRSENSDKRVFILTRSAFAGQQRNAAVTWSGDIGGTWEVFRAQIPAGLNFSMSGIPYWNTDTGGFFSGDPANASYAELYTRWFQFSTFCPMFRVHGDGPPKEIWRFDAPTQKILANFEELRYHLLPYIYSTSWRVTNEGYSMMRGLVMDFRSDARVYNVGDEFMFGPALLVAPVTKAEASNREVYLPAGSNWTDFWTGKTLAGGSKVEAETPISAEPLFVRAGSIVPYGPKIEYATEKDDPIELRVYPGADGTFTIYEDEGDNYNYERGAYSTIPIRWDNAQRTLTIGKRSGTFAGMKKEHTFQIVWVKAEHGTGVALTENPDEVIHYTGAPIEKKMR